MGFNLGNIVKTIPIIGGAFDDSGEKGMDALKANRDLMAKIKVPNLQFEDFRPEDYNPEDTQFQTISDDPLTRSAQLSALSKMAGLADTGLSDVDQLGYHKAIDLGNQVAQSNRAAVTQDALNRGTYGGGLEMAMKEAGNQDAAQRAQQAGLQTAADSAQNRALMQKAYFDALGNQRTQDFNNNEANANIINQFNTLNTQAHNQAQQYNVGNRNSAQMYNQEGRRGVQQQNFNNAVTKAGGQTQANTGLASGYAAQNAANQAQANAYMQIGGQIAAAAAGAPPTKKPGVS